MYKIEYHKRAIKDIIKLKENNLDKKTKKLIEVLKENPFQNPPPYEKLTETCYSTILCNFKCIAEYCRNL